MAALDFNPTEAEPSRPRDAVPSNKYLLQAVVIDEKPTNDKKGKILAFQWEIIDGEFSGSRVFDNINTHNPSEIAQKIGREQLAGILLAMLGEGQNVSDTDEMLFKPIVGTVKLIPEGTVDKAKPGSGKEDYVHKTDKNVVTGYSVATGYKPNAAPVARPSTPAPSRQGTPTAASAPAATTFKKPWETPRRAA